MGIAIISFTFKGGLLGKGIKEYFDTVGTPCSCYCFYKYAEEGSQPFKELKPLVGELFATQEMLLFIGATGIAVRSIAPFLMGKDKDPAILVMDECGHHVISLLSGHLGGANTWCNTIANLVGANPVITTATDKQHVFAIDLFAKANDLYFEDLKVIKEVSSKLLHGEKVGLWSDLPIEGKIPPMLIHEFQLENGVSECGIVITTDNQKAPFVTPYRLMPRDLVVGIGCRKGKEQHKIRAFIEKICQYNQLSEKRILKIVSIDLKQNEEGITQEAKRRGIMFETYSAAELGEVEGLFEESIFVTQTVGVSNVCERAAVRGSDSGVLIIGKTVEDGMTLAVAQCKKIIRFE